MVIEELLSYAFWGNSVKEYIKQMTEPQFIPALMEYFEHEIRCQHCDYKKRYTAP